MTIDLPYPDKASLRGKVNNRNWTDAELLLLRAAYAAAVGGTKLGIDALAQSLGRSKSSVCRKARQLGLTDPTRKKPTGRPLKRDMRKYQTDEELSVARSQALKERHAKTPHPMKGKTHTHQAREKISQKSKAAWAAKTPQEREAWIDKLLESQAGAPKVARGTWKAGWREIGGKRNYYRSRWEANYARYLEWLKTNGEIVEWQHEPETFWFEAIKRGVRSYKPDFRVWEVSGKSNLHEVKGWMDARSKTTLKRMAKYHPAEAVIVIREKQYNEIARKIGPMIEGWESGGRADRP